MENLEAQALAAGLVVVPVLWVVWAAACLGVGRLAARLVAAPAPEDAAAVLRDVWLGLAVAQIALVVWSLVLPVSGAAATTWLLAGAFGLWRDPRAICVAGASVRGARPLAIAAALAVVWVVANRAVSPMVNDDSATYEFPGMAWAEAYPAVPGLANLHGRLGFNNASVLLAAALDRGPWPGHAHHLLNGLLITLVAATLWAEGRRAAAPVRGALWCLVAPLVIALQNPEAVASLTADTPAAAFTIVAFVLTLVAVGQPAPAAVRSGLVCTIAAGAVSATAAKLSAAVVAGGTAALALAWWWSVGRPGRRTLAAVAAVVLVGGGAWLVRGAVLSGHPLYPSGVLAVPVDWRTPEAARLAELEWIRDDNRYMYRQLPPDVLPTPAVAVRWARATFAFHEARASVLVPALLMLIGLAALAGEAVVRRRMAWTVWTPVLPPLAGIALWWVMAPTPEFGSFVFWIGAAASFGVAAGRLADRGTAWRRVVLTVLVCVALSPLALDIKRRAEVVGVRRAIAAALVWAPDLALPAFPRQPYATASGLALTYPAADDRCGPVVLCTPHPAPNLVLRDVSRVARGFRVDGAWQALWYPGRHASNRTYWRDLPAR